MDDKPPPVPPAIGAPPDEEAFFQMAEAALAGLPDAFRPHVAELLLAIEDVADAETLAEMDIEHPYDLTGLYQGRPLTEKSVEESGGLPDRVILYRLPILVEWIETGERLDQLIRNVLIHEIGHHFGFSDEDMEAIEAAESGGA
jgi:predicted Zn-dependent protease with MMP-like domain